jgi:hypothetical protein
MFPKCYIQIQLLDSQGLLSEQQLAAGRQQHACDLRGHQQGWRTAAQHGKQACHCLMVGACAMGTCVLGTGRLVAKQHLNSLFHARPGVFDL